MRAPGHAYRERTGERTVPCPLGAGGGAWPGFLTARKLPPYNGLAELDRKAKLQALPDVPVVLVTVS